MNNPEGPHGATMRERAETEAAEAQLQAVRPRISLLHHMAATQAMLIGFTVTLLDGSAYKVAQGDAVFTDGLSVVIDGRRRYFPLTAIKEILVHNPGDA